jgi:hypothetical protein
MNRHLCTECRPVSFEAAALPAWARDNRNTRHGCHLGAVSIPPPRPEAIRRSSARETSTHVVRRFAQPAVGRSAPRGKSSLVHSERDPPPPYAVPPHRLAHAERRTDKVHDVAGGRIHGAAFWCSPTVVVSQNRVPSRPVRKRDAVLHERPRQSRGSGCTISRTLSRTTPTITDTFTPGIADIATRTNIPSDADGSCRVHHPGVRATTVTLSLPERTALGAQDGGRQGRDPVG